VQATLGNTITIPVLGNEKGEDLLIPPGTQPGDILTLHGLGMPSLQRGRRGDLFVRISVKIPKKLTPRQRELLDEFAKSEGPKEAKESKKFWQKITRSQ
jgi:molecular chaperone DnaJ